VPRDKGRQAYKTEVAVRELNFAMATLATLLTTARVSADEAGPVTVTPTMSATTTSSGQPIVLPQKNVQVNVSIYEIAPNAKLPEHEHPFPRYGYVMAGTLRVTNTETGRSLDFKPGDFILEAIGQWHKAENIGTDTIRLLVIDQIEKDHPNTILRK
jgi:quercetin dioxygenase-like cupin family protein